MLGAGVTLASLGAVSYAIPALGHTYRAGNPHAMEIADSFFTWPRGAMIYPAALVPVGSILFTVALWRWVGRGTLQRGRAVRLLPPS